MNKLISELREILIENFGTDSMLEVNRNTISVKHDKLRIFIEYDFEGDVYDVYGEGVISNADYAEAIEEVNCIISKNR